MKTLAKILVTVILICGLAAGGIYYYLFQAGDKTPLQQLVPSDALAYADIKEFRKFALEIATSGQAAAFAEIGKIVAGLFAVAQNGQLANSDSEPKAPEMPELQWSALLNAATHFNRQIAVFALESEIEALPFHGYAIAHFQGDPESFETAIQTFIDSINHELAINETGASPLSIQSETIDGNAIQFIALPKAETGAASIWEIHPSWTVIDGKCIFGFNPDSLAEYLDTLKTITPETSLENHSGFALASEYQPKMDGQAHLNMEGLVESMARFANETIGPIISQAGVSVDKIIDALGLRELETSFYAYDFDATSSLLTNGLVYREPKGILALYTNTGEIEPPSFIPSASYTSSSTALDVGEAILIVKDIVLQAVPIAGILYPNYKQLADRQLGQDVEVFARKTFTAEFHTFGEIIIANANDAKIPELGQSHTYVFGLSDAESFEKFLDQQIAPLQEEGLLEFVEEDVAGFSVRSIADKTGADSPSFGYAIADDKLFIGYGAGEFALQSMKNALTLLASNESGALQTPKVSQFLLANKENAISISLFNLGTLLRTALQYVSLFEAAAKRDGDLAILDALERIDWKALEHFDLKLAAVVNKEDHLLLTRARSFSE